MKANRIPHALAALTLAVTSQVRATVVYDLNATGTVSVPTTNGTAIFKLDSTQPTGTGVFDPFMTLQTRGNGGPQEGYNASFDNFDSKRDPNWNRDLKMSDLRTVVLGNTTFFSFIIDVNEPDAENRHTKPLISLDALKIYTSQSAVTDLAGFSQLGAPRFDLDLPEETFIKYDDTNSGSGMADIAFYIPVSAFQGASLDDYVYMYQHWGSLYEADGSLPDYDAQGGFEETAVGAGDTIDPRNPVFTPVPEPGSMAALMGLLAGGAFLRSRRTPKA